MVSIITNCFNGEKYLDETIQSVLNQTYQDWEYILFDNNSNDKSAEIFLSYNDSRFKYYRNDITVPLGHGRHKALKMAMGDYVCFIDSDDLWLPDNLKKQVAVMEGDSQIGVVYSDMQNFGMKDNLRKTSPEGYRNLPDVMEFYDLGLSSTMLRRSTIEKYNFEINKTYDLIADYDLFIRMIHVSKCYHIKEPLVKYRIHNSNLTKLSTKGEVEYEEMIESLNYILSEEEREQCKNGMQRLYDHYYTYKYRNLINSKQWITAFSLLPKISRRRWILANIKYAAKALLR